jgi:hypothetical protein
VTPGGLCFKCQSWVGIASYAADGVPLSKGGSYDKQNARFACYACDQEFARRRDLRGRCVSCLVVDGVVPVHGGLQCEQCYDSNTERIREEGRDDVARIREGYRSGGMQGAIRAGARDALASLAHRATMPSLLAAGRRAGGAGVTGAVRMLWPDLVGQDTGARGSFDEEMAKLGLGRLRNKHARKRKL